MRVGDIGEDKKARVTIDGDDAMLHYPPAGKEHVPETPCNTMALDAEDEEDAVFEAASYLGIEESEIEVVYR